MQKWFSPPVGRLAVALAAVGIVAGCSSQRVPSVPPEQRIRIHVEADPDLMPGKQVQMPIAGGQSIAIYRDPEITDYDIAAYKMMMLPDGGTALEIRLTDNGRETLEGLTSRHVGRRLVIVVRDQVVGLMPIEGPIRTGRILMRAGE